MTLRISSCIAIVSAFALGACSAENGDEAASSDAPAQSVSDTIPGQGDLASEASDQAVMADQSTVPERFRGLFAIDQKACAQDYSYAPAFQNITIEAQEVLFFETGGPVIDVNVDGDAAAITLLEAVGDEEAPRAVYLALNADGSVRYKAGESEPSRNFVRCEGE